MVDSAVEFSPEHLAILRDLLGDPDASVARVEFLNEGWTNANFRVNCAAGDLVLRVCVPVQRSVTADRRFELEVWSGPASTLGAPLIGYRLPEGHALSRFVAGPLLSEQPPEPAELANHTLRVHGELGVLARRYEPRLNIDGNLARARRSGYRPAPAVAGALQKLLLESDTHEAEVGCHNDFNPWNVIRSGPDEWCTLDWETAGNNDPLYDLVCMSEGLNWAEAERDEALGCYYETVGRALSVDRVVGFTLLFQLGSYAWAFAQLCDGNERAELHTQVETSLTRIAQLS